MLRIIKKNLRAQTLLEYSIVLSVIVLAIIFMSNVLRWGITGFVKDVADQVGNQKRADQPFDDQGHLEETLMSSRIMQDQTRQDRPGKVGFLFGDRVETGAVSQINLGFTEQNPFQ